MTTKKSRAADEADGIDATPKAEHGTDHEMAPVSAPEPSPVPTVTPDDLAQFMGVPLSADHARQSIDAAHATLESAMGQSLPRVLGHNLAQAERHLAAHMAITDRQTPLPVDEIPAVARYFLMLEAATAARGDKL